jgi:hypothetical protein
MGDDKLFITDLIQECSNGAIVAALTYHRTVHSFRCDCMWTLNCETLKSVLLRRLKCVYTSSDTEDTIYELLELSLQTPHFFETKEKKEPKQEDVVNLLHTFVEVFRLVNVVINDILSIAGFKDKESLFDALTSGAPISNRIKLAAQVAEKYLLNKK